MEVTSGQEPSRKRGRGRPSLFLKHRLSETPPFRNLRKRWISAHCIVEGCQNSRKEHPKMTFHLFPTKHPSRLKRWLVALNLDLNTPKKILQRHVVCEKHFVHSDYYTRNSTKPWLYNDAVPSVGINTKPIVDKMAVLKAWEETVTAELSDGESLIECDDELEPLTLSSEEDEDQTDPTGENSQATHEQENEELLGDQDIFLFAPIEEDDDEEEEEQGEENEEVQMEESSASGDAGLHHEEEETPPDWTASAPKRTRLHATMSKKNKPSPDVANATPAGGQEAILQAIADLRKEFKELEEAQVENIKTQVDHLTAEIKQSPERSSESSVSLMGFKLNGSHVLLQSVDGGVTLKLTSRTGGSACGFTCIKLSPITTSSTPVHTSNYKSKPVHHYNNITQVHTSNSKTTPVHLNNNITPVLTNNSKSTPVHRSKYIIPVHNRSKPFTSSTSPKTDRFPVITRVVCGSAAEVLSRQTVNSSDKAALIRMTAKQVVRSYIASLPPTPSRPEAPRLHNKPSPDSLFSSRGRLIKPKGPLGTPGFQVKPLQKGLRGQVRPPDCTVCHSRYKKVQCLRGFVCLCSIEIMRCLKDARFKGLLKKKHRVPRSTSPRTALQTSKTRVPSLLPPPLHHLPPTSPARRHPSRVTPPMPHLSPVSPLRKQHLPPPVSSSPLSSTSSASSTSASPLAGLRQHLSPPPPPVSSSPLSSASSTSTVQFAALHPSPSPPSEQLVILVEDFFYGTDEGRRSAPDGRSTKKAGPYTCDHCHASLQNNTSFMSHTQQHIEEMYGVNDCPHCYRNFENPFRLERHLEVHSPYNTLSTCKICELSFANEAALLHHMKCTHKPGEMPYMCQVCGYRSSFYSSVVRHFRGAHVNTCYLLCVYCLRVFNTRATYQQHTTRHKSINYVYSCNKCRLLFLYARDRKLHKQCCHITHIRPRQLNGLKPGTKVTVRSLREYPETVKDEPDKCLVPSPEVSHVPGSSRHLDDTEPPVIILDDTDDDDSNDATDTTTSQHTWGIRYPRQEIKEEIKPEIKQEIKQETQGGERTDLQDASEPSEPSLLSTSTCNDATDTTTSQHTTSCIECQHAVPNGWDHFVSEVRCCILCTYTTYCSRAYANHMMSHNHMTEKTNSNYSTMYQSYPRLPRKLGCQFCTYVTTTGDMMANHLAEHPGHRAMAVNVSEEHSGRNPGGGSVIPIQLPAGPASPQLSINTHPSPCPLPTSPSPIPTSPSPLPTPTSPLPTVGISAITLTSRSPQTASKVLDPKKDSERRSTRSQRAPPLLVSELMVVLYSLCNGVPQAAQYFRSDPALIRDWTLQHIEDTIKDNAPSTWHLDYLAEWVLTQREQQLFISEDILMRAATKCLKHAALREAYCWAVNFMLSHSLSLQPLATTTDSSTGPNRPLPKNLSENAKTFTLFLQKQLQTGLPPGAVGYLDELSIFIDLGRLSSSSAFSLFSSQADTPPLVDIMLSGLADGTCFSPTVFYAGASPVLPKGFPTNITLLAAPGGFPERRRLDLWHQKVWGPHMSHHNRGVLIMDTHRGHLDDHFLSTLSSSHTAPVVIPIGCSSRLQPLDVCITPVVREFLQARWSQLLSYGGAEGLTIEQLVVTLCCWVSEVASALSDHQEILRRSFAMVLATPGKMELEGANEMIQTLTQALID